MYEHIGTHPDVAPILHLVNSFEYKWAPQGYRIVDGRERPLESTVHDLAGIPGGPWVFSMVIKLEQGDNIPPHCDKPLPVGVTRYHLVLQSNDMSYCMHDGDWQQLAAGGLYIMNPRLLHAAINWGNTPRIHLVVDTEDA